MREASERRTATDTDSYAFSFINQSNANEGTTAADFCRMRDNLSNALKLIEEYNQLYNTSFKALPPYRLFPGDDGDYEFKNQQWPGNEHAGVYLILSRTGEVIYVGQSLPFGSRFYQYFRNEGGKCIILSDNWSAMPYAIVAIQAPDEKKYERLSLEEYLIQNLLPIDNVRGK